MTQNERAEQLLTETPAWFNYLGYLGNLVEDALRQGCHIEDIESDLSIPFSDVPCFAVIFPDNWEDAKNAMCLILKIQHYSNTGSPVALQMEETRQGYFLVYEPELYKYWKLVQDTPGVRQYEMYLVNAAKDSALNKG